MGSPVRHPVRVAAVNDYEIVVQGLAALLRRHPEQLEVCDAVVIGESLAAPVDVVLYDSYGRDGIAAPALRQLVATPEVGAVALFTIDLHPDLIAAARAAGARGVISKALGGEEIAGAIVAVAAGAEFVVAAPDRPRPASRQLDWPAKEAGLSERESEVLVLLADGLTNREIARALYLSTETVKGYVARVFAKLEVRNRVEAAAYVRDSGVFHKYRSAAGALARVDQS